jgi:hypothetical protein
LKLEIRNWGDETSLRVSCLQTGRRKVLSKSNVAEYKVIVEKLGPKLHAFINNTEAQNPNFQFLISTFRERLQKNNNFEF